MQGSVAQAKKIISGQLRRSIASTPIPSSATCFVVLTQLCGRRQPTSGNSWQRLLTRMFVCSDGVSSEHLEAIAGIAGRNRLCIVQTQVG